MAAEGSTGPIVASKKMLKEYVTPHKIALLVLIKEYCVIKAKPQSQRVFTAPEWEDWAFSEKQMRDFMITIMQLIQAGDLELKELVFKVKDISKPKLTEFFTTRLKEVCTDGVRGIMDYFQSLTDTLFAEQEPMVNKNSLLGLYIRRMTLAFDTLSFNQVCKLYQQYKLYVETLREGDVPSKVEVGVESEEDVDMEMTDQSELSEDQGLGDTPQKGVTEEEEELVAGAALEDSLAAEGVSSLFMGGAYSHRQAEFFIVQQASLLQHNDSEALPPRLLQEKIHELLSSNPQLAEAHYLNYLNNLRINEYCGAIDSLYHYFDRHSLASNGNSGNKVREEEQTGRSFRYAALNLASLHFRFGHREETLAAIREAIRMAQETNDNICLQHALGWLHRLGVDEDEADNTTYLLDRSVTKSGELNLPYLSSLGVQGSARHNAMTGTTPASVFEFIQKSDIWNCQHSQMDLMSISYAQKAALWQLYGKREMCSLMSQLLLNLTTSDAGVYHNSEACCIALCNLAHNNAKQGEYAAVMEILANAKRRFPPLSQHSQLWMQCEQEILYEKAMRHGKWLNAKQAVTSLAALNADEAKYREAQVHQYQGETDQALQLLQNLKQHLKIAKNNQNIHLLARVLMSLGELHCQTGNTITATEPLLEALALARDCHMTYLVAMATLYLAYVQLSMGLPARALALIEQVLVPVLSQGSLYDQACAQYLYVKANVATAAGLEADRRRSALSSAIPMLSDTVRLFTKLQAHSRAKDVLYYQARLYHELGYSAERNKCALEFRKLDQQYPTVSGHNIHIV